MYRTLNRKAVRGAVVAILVAGLGPWCPAAAGEPSPVAAPEPAGVSAMTVQQWQEDLDFFSKELASRHVDFFKNVNRESYYAAVGALRRDIPALEAGQIVAGLMELAALSNDANTLVWPFQPALGYTILPIQAYWFDDGIFITSADEEYLYLVGSRIAKIGGVDVDQVFERVVRAIGAENVYHQKSWFFVYGFCPELLHALRITQRSESVKFTLVSVKGETYEADVSGVTFSAYARKYFLTPVEFTFTPVVTNRRANNFWYRFIPALRTIYVQINELRDQPGGQSVDGFAARLAAFADTTRFDRVVLDLRRRGGGNAYLAGRFADVISGHERINRPDSLFTIIGRATSGTMVELASMLEYRTKTVFVGEPCGEGPNGTGESGTFKLPHSNIEVYFAASHNETSVPEDDRRYITPDIPAEYTYQDFLDGRDPAMAEIFNHRPGHPAAASQDAAGARRMVGRYLFSPHQILEIKYRGAPAGNGLEMTVTDFIDGSAFKVKSGLYAVSPIKYVTDIKGVELSAAAAKDEYAGQIFVSWKGHDRTVQRADDGYLLPVELINVGRIEAGVTALLSSKASREYYKKTTRLFLESKGYALLNEGKLEDAIRIFRANTELHPEDAGVWIGLGDAFAAGGNRDLARTFYEKSLELDPGNGTAAARLSGLE